MKLQTKNKKTDELIAEFQKAFDGVRTNVKRCGEVIISLAQQEVDAFEVLLKNVPGTTLPMLESFERVGAGLLDERLLTDFSPAAERAIEECISSEDQKILLESTIPVAVKNNGGARIEHKRCSEIKASEVRRVIRDGKIQSGEAQIEILNQEIAAKAESVCRYIADPSKSEVRFLTRETWTWAQLQEICDKIKPKPSDIQGAIQKNQIK